jgi:hypothetical protein
MATPIRKHDPGVFVDGQQVFITNLEIENHDLVELVAASTDPGQTVREVACLGAGLMRMTQTTVDAAVIENRFETLEQRVDEGVTKAVDLISEIAASYLDPKSGALKTIVDEFEQNFDAAFDPDSKSGVLAKFEGALTGGTAEIKNVVREVVDPGNPESPLHDLTEGMKDVRQALSDLRTQVAVDQAKAEMLELTAIKGRKFEEVAAEAVCAAASLHGDAAEPVGDLDGSAANKCGDVLVTLSPDATAAATGCIVVEAKDKRLSLRETHAELDRAMKNRDAQAGVIVFSKQEKAPTVVPLQTFGSKVVVVLDKDELDERALRLGIAAARCFVQRQLTGADRKALDTEAVLALVEDGQRELVALTTVKGCLTRAEKQITAAGDWVDGLRLDEILGQIAAKLQQ